MFAAVPFFVDMPRLSVEIQHDGLAVVNCVPVSRFENMKRELDRFKVFNVVFVKFGRTENYAVNGTFSRTNFAGKISADHKSVCRFVTCLNGHVFYAQLWWNNQKTARMKCFKCISGLGRNTHTQI